MNRRLVVVFLTAALAAISTIRRAEAAIFQPPGFTLIETDFLSGEKQRIADDLNALIKPESGETTTTTTPSTTETVSSTTTASNTASTTPSTTTPSTPAPPSLLPDLPSPPRLNLPLITDSMRMEKEFVQNEAGLALEDFRTVESDGLAHLGISPESPPPSDIDSVPELLSVGEQFLRREISLALGNLQTLENEFMRVKFGVTTPSTTRPTTTRPPAPDVAEDRIDITPLDDIALSGVKLAATAIKVNAKIIAPLFKLGAKITAPIIALKAKIAAPFILKGAALAKPAIVAGAVTAGPALALGGAATSALAAAAAPLTGPFMDALAPIRAALAPLGLALAPIGAAAAAGIGKLPPTVNQAFDLKNFGPEFKLLQKEALNIQSKGNRFLEKLRSGIPSLPEVDPVTNEFVDPDADVPVADADDADEAGNEDEGEGEDDEAVVENEDPADNELPPPATRRRRSVNGYSPGIDMVDQVDAYGNNKAKGKSGKPRNVRDIGDDFGFPQPSASPCTASMVSETTSECHKTESYLTRACSSAPSCGVDLGINAIFDRCSRSAPGVHCDKQCYHFDDPRQGTCFECITTFTRSIKTTGRCQRYNDCLFNNLICHNGRGGGGQ